MEKFGHKAKIGTGLQLYSVQMFPSPVSAQYCNVLTQGSHKINTLSFGFWPNRGGGVSPILNLYFDFSLEKRFFLETLVNHLLGVLKHFFFTNMFFWTKINQNSEMGGGLRVSAKIRNSGFFWDDFSYLFAFWGHKEAST